ncbi:Sensory box/GGDEF family protein [Desulfosarcina cetonica]|uniref:sensor domain-containing protein n=1 Tax=Desulfosarcina cetonica TaxID=90730 RepID=UPI0006CFA17E|nr:bifunctional diguanylate cyclase/phosphodiesterase [Desulfosarcina cetonica]VTR71176.1 Sensory box/GGDEF family protein [Desulfosarcina cetonica]
MVKKKTDTANFDYGDARLAQARHRLLFERFADAVVVCAADGRILDFNPAALTFFDIPANGLRDANITTFYANQADRQALLRQVDEKGIVQNAPLIFVDHRETVKHGLVTIMRLDTPDGCRYGYQEQIRDVTQHRQAEKKLRDQMDFASQLFAVAPEAIVLLDMEDRVLRANEEFCRLFQYPSEKCTHRPIEELIVPQALRAESLSMSARAMAGERFELETRRMRRDGTLVDVSVLAKPIAMEDGSPAVYVIYRDITKRKQAEEAFRKSEARYRTVLEVAPDPVIVMDMDSRVIYVNPAFTQVFGWHLDDCRNQTIDFIPPKAQPATDRFMDLLRQGIPFSGIETQRHARDGTLVDVSISGAVFLDEAGHPEGYVNTLQDITQRCKKDAELRYVAYHDTLTNLPNRKSFYMLLDDLLQHAARRSSDRSWALMFLDLDKFKQVNDTLGHDTGDRLLKEVAERLKACLRESDYLFRLGGDEFTIILTNLNLDIDVARVARKILQSISQVYRLDGHEIFTSTSIGISVFPNDGWDVEALVKNADMAMYAAKENGGSGYRFFTEEMNYKAQHRMKMEVHLRKAIQNEELRLHYQPLVDRRNRIVGVEALIRWHNPELGFVLPADFIRVTEDTGIIVAVGRWVLSTACTQAKHWQRMGFKNLSVSVNISSRQMQEPDFEAMVLKIIAASGLPPELLNLEITESSVIQNPEVCLVKMKRMRDHGISFSIDDFGTGYSSLSYLKRFPIDTLKIDRSFISDALKCESDKEMVRTIIAMARALNIHTVAEGVETREQMDFLARSGCDLMQGYLFSPPLPADRLEALLKAGIDGKPASGAGSPSPSQPFPGANP